MATLRMSLSNPLDIRVNRIAAQKRSIDEDEQDQDANSLGPEPGSSSDGKSQGLGRLAPKGRLTIARRFQRRVATSEKAPRPGRDA